MSSEENKQNTESETTNIEPVVETEISKNEVEVIENEKPEVVEPVSNSEIIEKPIEDNNMEPVSVEDSKELTQENSTPQPLEPLEMKENNDEYNPVETLKTQTEIKPEVIESEADPLITSSSNEQKPEITKEAKPLEVKPEPGVG
jgi:hypothetical protein